MINYIRLKTSAFKKQEFLLLFGGIGITKLMGVYEVTPPPINSETKITSEEKKVI